MLPGGVRWGRSEALGKATNNQAELWAIGLAFDLISTHAPDLRVEIRSDSQYTIKHMTAQVFTGSSNKRQALDLRTFLSMG